MHRILLKDATLVGERILKGDLLIENDRIAKMGGTITAPADTEIIDCHELIALPGLIDPHVHMREPGSPQKATIRSESRAAVLGGVTSVMEMPNTSPSTTTMERVREKQEIASRDCVCNSAFYLGAAGDNLDDIRSADITQVAGIKVYMGSTTGSLLVDREESLLKTFEAAPCLIMTHCEDTALINARLKDAKERYGDDIPYSLHGLIRSRDASLKSTRLAVALALETHKQLQVAHISTREEVALLTALATGSVKERQISGEACLPHLFFSEAEYGRLKGYLKCNPAVKTEADRRAIVSAVRQGVLTTIGTDHAPHEKAVKVGPYTRTASGLPAVQFLLSALLELWSRRELTLEEIVRATSRNVAERYALKDRGLLKEGYFADIALVNPVKSFTVTEESLASLCRWSPFEGHTFPSAVVHTVVSGRLKVRNGSLCSDEAGQPLYFDRV